MFADPIPEKKFWETVRIRLNDLKRRTQLRLRGYKHQGCGLCGEKWSVDYYGAVNHHGDCSACAKAQYGD